MRARRLVPPFYFEKDDAARAREKGVLRQVSTDQVTLLRRPAAVGGVQRHEGTDPVDAVGVAAQEPPT